MLGALLGIAGGLGSVFGKAAGSQSDARNQQAQNINFANRNAIDLYGTQQGAQFNAGSLDLQRKQFEEQARSGRARQATIADILANFAPTQVSVPGITPAQISGGIQIGPGARASLAELYKQALAKQLSGDTFQGGQILNAPQLQGLPKASGFEKFLDIAGLIGSGAGAIGATMDARRGQ